MNGITAVFTLAGDPGAGCVGHRLDGWPNRDLNVGALVALASDLSPVITLLDVAISNSVVDHYNTCKNLNLSSSEKKDLVQYLLSLTFGPQSNRQACIAPFVG